MEIRPYKSFESMKYGEVDIFSHKPIVRSIDNGERFSIRLTTDELYFLDDDGYPTKSKIILLYKPREKVLDRKTFKMLLSRLRNERLHPISVFEYISNFMNKLVSPRYTSMQLNVVSPYKRRSKYVISEENSEVTSVHRNSMKLVDITPYIPNHEHITENEKKIYSTSELTIIPVTRKNDEDKDLIIDVPYVTFLNKYSGFPEYCNVRVTVKVSDKTLDTSTRSFENMLHKLRYTYLTEEEFVNYVASLVYKLHPNYFNIQCSFNPRGSVGYDISFSY